MRQASIKTASEQTESSKRIIAFSEAIIHSSSAIERTYWQKQFATYLRKLLASAQQQSIVTALDYLLQQNDITYDVCIDEVESCCETHEIVHNGIIYDIQLIAAPILAWTRFSIASGQLPAPLYQALLQEMKETIFADGVQFYLSPMLYAIEQLPQDYHAVNVLTEKLGKVALGLDKGISTITEQDTAPFLADTRYLISAVAVPRGKPFFQWQEVDSPLHIEEFKRKQLKVWGKKVSSLITSFLVGCHVDILLPQAYFLSCREADKFIRPISIKATLFYLTQALQVPEAKLHVNIAKCSRTLDNTMIDEFRVGFSLGDSDEVLYGIIWPLYDEENSDSSDEEESLSPLETLTALLEESGVTHIKQFAEVFAAEFCEDCKAPLFPNKNGELVHTDMPEEIQHQQLH